MVEMAGIEPASERLNHSDIYECRQLFGVIRWTTTAKSFIWLAAGTRKFRLIRSSGVIRPHSCFLTFILLQQEVEGGERDCFYGSRLLSSLLMQRGGEQHIQCGWHLKFCADFTRTAPLGSQSGANLFRRYLSSPLKSLYHRAVSGFIPM